MLPMAKQINNKEGRFTSEEIKILFDVETDIYLSETMKLIYCLRGLKIGSKRRRRRRRRRQQQPLTDNVQSVS